MSQDVSTCICDLHRIPQNWFVSVGQVNSGARDTAHWHMLDHVGMLVLQWFPAASVRPDLMPPAMPPCYTHFEDQMLQMTQLEWSKLHFLPQCKDVWSSLVYDVYRYTYIYTFKTFSMPSSFWLKNSFCKAVVCHKIHSNNSRDPGHILTFWLDGKLMLWSFA